MKIWRQISHITSQQPDMSSQPRQKQVHVLHSRYNNNDQKNPEFPSLRSDIFLESTLCSQFHPEIRLDRLHDQADERRLREEEEEEDSKDFDDYYYDYNNLHEDNDMVTT